ncbi:unnamed protein product [Leptidea sinapis]|uniref:Uncharacterized protein n=1 Tax=Leptidea sinapis TaxID=189913 RepID=A0A5E4PTT7_9NEOP|nr:unnamed protein product [Leptidea sinapis]
MDIELFISEIQSRPAIWDSKSDSYSNRGEKDGLEDYRNVRCICVHSIKLDVSNNYGFVFYDDVFLSKVAQLNLLRQSPLYNILILHARWEKLICIVMQHFISMDEKAYPLCNNILGFKFSTLRTTLM